jgi:ferredoxin-NADP reductase
METTVEAVRSVGPSTVALDLATPDGFDALPGQFVRLTDDGDGGFYTLSSPDVADRFEVTVGVDPERADFSAWLADRSPGDPIGVEGPFGDASYDGTGRPVVLAGGPGIGPAVGIAERALDAEASPAIVYETDAPAHGDRLDRLTAAGADVRVVDELDAASVSEVVTGEADERVYVYGFDPFVDRAEAALDAASVPDDRIAVESFG